MTDYLFQQGAAIARQIPKASDVRGVLDIALPAALLVLAYTLLLWTEFHILACIAAFFMVSKAQFSLLLSGHEATHYSLFTNRRLNDFAAAFVCFGPMGVGFNIARAAHLDHHRYLLTERDLKIEQQVHEPTKRRLIVHLLLPLFGHYILKGVLRLAGLAAAGRARPTFVVTPAQRRMDIVSIMVPSLVLLAAFTAIDWRLYIFFWTGPLFTLTAFFLNMKAMMDHARMPDETEGLLYTYDIHWYDRLIFGTQQHRHAEHHLWPHVPHHKLALLSPVTSRMDDVRSRGSMLACLIRYYQSLPSAVPTPAPRA